MEENSNTTQENSQDQTVESNDIQTDIFEQVFNVGGEDPFNVEESIQPDLETVVEDEPVGTLDVNEAKENDSQFQYWQSQADKNKLEVEVLRAEMEALKQPAQPSKETEESTLVKPEKPVKPVDYDYSDALADPSSSSAQYLQGKEDYLENMSDYIVKKDEVREEQMNLAQKEQSYKQQQQDTLSELQSKYNYTPEQASDFVVKMSSPESLSMDNLVKLHQMNIPSEVQIAEQVSPQAQAKTELMQSRQEKLSIPKPIGVQQGTSVQSPGDSNIEDQMMDVMINNFKKTNIF